MMTKYKDISNYLGGKVKPCVIRAIAEVESSGNGFLKNGDPKILFEPHVFWRCLVKKKINPKKFLPKNDDILYPKWQRGRYGSINDQHGRLQRAVAIDREAALMSASWGAFQVLGENYKTLGYATIQDFVNDAYTEYGQVLMFARFIRANYLVDELERVDLHGFCRIYNGEGYMQNRYVEKMEEKIKEYCK